MKSTKCPECGFVGWADADCCKKCGAPLPAHWPEATELPHPVYGRPEIRIESPVGRKQGLAIASLVLGISGFAFICFAPIVSTVGLVLGIVALVKISRYPFEYGGKGMAVG